MASIIHATSLAVTTSLALILGGCANDGSSTFGSTMFGATTTASIPEKPRTDPACFALTSQIDALKKEGIAEKVEKAAAKKYKMTQADLGKADQLTKANAEFQLRCSTVAPGSVQASSIPASRPPSAKAAPKATNFFPPVEN